MKSFVNITILPDASGLGSNNEYIVDSAHPAYGEDLAEIITKAVDTRPDPAGRLAELRRHLAELHKVHPKFMRKPSGAKTPTARVQYNAVSRTTGAAAIVRLRHYDAPTDTVPNPDEPSDL